MTSRESHMAEYSGKSLRIVYSDEEFYPRNYIKRCLLEKKFL